MSNIITALESTFVIILTVILLGRIIDIIKTNILRFMARHLGSEFTIIFANWLTFIGTVHHELSHALTLLITGAKIVKLDIFNPKGNRLGQVKYINRGNFIIKSIQNTTSAIAPVLLGCLSEYLLYRALTSTSSLILMVLIIYTMLSILLHMTMSKQDLKMALRGLPICAVIIFLVTYITKFNIITFLKLM